MKYFKCGNCQTPYKIDETKINNTQINVKCNKCAANNIVRLGPVLVAQKKDGVQQYNLKIGENILGRKSKVQEASIVINDDYVSRKHAVIQLENIDNKLFISFQDLGSLNGSFNKNKIRLKSNLKYPFVSGDYFIIGLTKLTLKFN